MDGERQRKIEAGRRKLKAYKSRRSGRSSDESDSSFSLSPILPDNTDKTKFIERTVDSEPSSISENIVVSSPENDRSLQEIVITNIPGSSPEPNSILLKNPDVNIKSLNNSIISETSFISLQALEMFENINNTEHNQNIINEIIKNEDSLRSFNSDTLKNDEVDRNILTAKDFIPDLEIHSSNPSTMSLGTSTDYKIYNDKSNFASVEYQDLLSHRDEHIKQLTVALEQVLEDRNRLQAQAEHFAHEIDQLKLQLVQTTAVIKKHNWNPTPIDSENETIDDKISSIIDEDKVIDSNKKSEDVEKSPKTKFVEMDEKRDNEKEKTSPPGSPKSPAKTPPEKDSISKLIRISDINFESESIPFEDTFSPEELDIIQDIRCKINLYIETKMQEYKKVHALELKILEDQFETEKTEHVIEVAKLRELLTTVKSGSADVDVLRKELNEKHGKEMEELRTYFEERCAEIEKHYSEEIFSQHSRKMSVDSSLCSEIESEMYPNQCPQGGDSPAVGSDSKTDLAVVKLELQNKYHAELEILREDYENRIDELRIGNENQLGIIEKKYAEQLDALKTELEEAQKYVLTQQEVASSGDFEIAEVVQSYERRLQEQITLAKFDIISALELQIQNLITNQSEDREWPTELLQLREIVIKETKDQYDEDVRKLKEDYEKKLNRATEREKRNSIHSGDETELKKERDGLKKVTSHLRNLLAELIKYFTKCEDELNNTLIDELVKLGVDKDLSHIASELNDSFQSEASMSSMKIKRVHFAPDVSGIISLIDETNRESPNVSNISVEFQSELASCLNRLKSEANAILTATSTLKLKPTDSPDESFRTVDDKLTSLTRKLITEKQVKNDLSLQLDNAKEYIQSLETDKMSLETQLDHLTTKQVHLVAELDKAKEKIIDLVESGREEIISEGYGENNIGGTALGERIATFTELQNKARNLIVEGPSNSPLLNLVEDLCCEGDRIMEDARKDHEDLVKQIEAADKKLRATTQFLEDQAVDREFERDEAQKEIASLKEQLRKGEQKQDTCDRINREVERLESQMRDMSVLITESENKKAVVESELKEAIDKIWVLRDIIRDLETQIDEKTKAEKDFVKVNAQLQEKIKEQLKYNEDLCSELESFKCRGDSEYLSQHIHELEDELNRLRINTELAGPDGIAKKIKCQLNEIEKSIDKRIKELETSHTFSSTTSYSSPSTEDMSLRDQLSKPPSEGFDSDLPLEQLARIKDKLIRHSRIEDAAIKRIKDLEMQLFSVKHDFELLQNEKDCVHDELTQQANLVTSLDHECTKLKDKLNESSKQLRQLNSGSLCRCKDLEVLLNASRDDVEILQKEKEVLQEQLSEQMHIISSLQLRLDEQRLRVESVQKQSSCVLEHRIYELENELKELQEKVHIRDKNIKQLNAIIEQTKCRLADQQKQLNAESDREKEAIEEMRRELEVMKIENVMLKTKMNELRSMSNTPDIPELLDSMLCEKNAEIDRLKGQISGLRRELEVSPMRRQEESVESVKVRDLLSVPSRNDTVFIGSSFRDSKYDEKKYVPFITEVSSIEKVEFRPRSLSLNLDEITRSRTFSMTDESVHIPGYMVHNIKELRKKLEFSESILRDTKENLSHEIERLHEIEKELNFELAEVKVCNQTKTCEISELEKELSRKNDIIETFNNEKRSEIARYKQALEEKDREVTKLHKQLDDTNKCINKVESLQEIINELEFEMKKLQERSLDMEKQLSRKDSEYEKLQKDLNEVENELSKKQELIIQYETENDNVEHYRQKIYELEKMLTDQKTDLDAGTELICAHCEELVHKIQMIEQNYGHDVEVLENKYKTLLSDKDETISKNETFIDDLRKEVHHLQDFINQKDRIINQMTKDSNSLHKSLEAIQQKMQECGNVVDLKKRLRDEQNLTSSLHEEVQFLKQRVTELEMSFPIDDEKLKENYQQELAANKDLMQLRDNLIEELHILEARLQTEHDNVNRVQMMLDAEKQNSNSIQMQDANLIEKMRIRLEQALHREGELEKLLECERQRPSVTSFGSKSLDSPHDITFELTCVRMDLVKAKTENDILKSEISTLNNHNSMLKKELDETRHVTDIQCQEIKDLKLKISDFRGSESSLRDSLRMKNSEIDNNRKIMTELERERNILRNQLDDDQIHQPVPDKFLFKMKELTTLLHKNVAENSQMASNILQLEEENKRLSMKLVELEAMGHAKNSPFVDQALRADHIFGCYLKSESFRKALIYQKRYLLTLLATYQACSTRLVDLQLVYAKSDVQTNAKEGIGKFRSVAYAVIAISRMRFIVRRWKSGLRKGSNLSQNLPWRTSSSTACGPVRDSKVSKPWYGNSPPCKDMPNRSTNERQLGNLIRDGVQLSPLQTPQLLSQYIDRIDNIQQGLGLISNQSPT